MFMIIDFLLLKYNITKNRTLKRLTNVCKASLITDNLNNKFKEEKFYKNFFNIFLVQVTISEITLISCRTVII